MQSTAGAVGPSMNAARDVTSLPALVLTPEVATFINGAPLKKLVSNKLTKK